MSNRQARLIASPIVMAAGSLYAVVREEFALGIGFCVFAAGLVMFLVEYVRSFRK